MQFSLLDFLIGIPQAAAVASGAVATPSDQPTNPDAALFAELLADANASGGELAHGEPQMGGELVQELVANVTVVQDEAQAAYVRDDRYLANLQGVLNRKISPEKAGDLLEQFDTQAGGEQPPEALKEILEAVEAGGEPTTVQDILTQVVNSQPDDATEQRANTLQRALQWLQQALTPHAAPMEALAAVSAGTMFPQAEIASSERGKEKERTKEVAVMMPAWVEQIGNPESEKLPVQHDTAALSLHHVADKMPDPVASRAVNTSAPFAREALPEVELPDVHVAEAAPVEDAPLVEDALVLVATKHNHADKAQGAKTDVFDAMVTELSHAPVDDVGTMEHSAEPISTETDITILTPASTHSTTQEQRVAETVRTHHANFAYLRSEVMDQVKVGVTKAVSDGVDRITIQLNPQDLGRVEVKMDIVADGMSQVSFLVDKQETFDLLQRDARSLERMLQDAGVRADAGSMEFNLRQESQSKEPWGATASRDDGESKAEISNVINPGELPTQMYVHLVSDRIDIRA